MGLDRSGNRGCCQLRDLRDRRAPRSACNTSCPLRGTGPPFALTQTLADLRDIARRSGRGPVRRQPRAARLLVAPEGRLVDSKAPGGGASSGPTPLIQIRVARSPKVSPHESPLSSGRRARSFLGRAIASPGIVQQPVGDAGDAPLVAPMKYSKDSDLPADLRDEPGFVDARIGPGAGIITRAGTWC